MGNLNFLNNVMKTNKTHGLPRVSRAVVTLCVFGFWSGLKECGKIENRREKIFNFPTVPHFASK